MVDEAQLHDVYKSTIVGLEQVNSILFHVKG
jgi:hypothetical protein